jgi:hypothetical protein
MWFQDPDTVQHAWILAKYDTDTSLVSSDEEDDISMGPVNLRGVALDSRYHLTIYDHRDITRKTNIVDSIDCKIA